MAEYIVEMEQIQKAYDGVPALDGVTLNVRKGEQVAIIGSSGSGKSTLLRCVNHLEEIDGGRIAINGENLAETGPDGRVRYQKDAGIRRLIMQTGMVFQHFNLFGHLTCMDNITIAPVQIKKEDPAEVRQRAAELLRVVGLESKAGAYPAQLSGGQKQRIAIARAILRSAPVLILDEATASVDMQTEYKIQQAIQGLTGSRTIFAIAHRLSTIRRADLILVFEDGRITQRGTHEELICAEGMYRTLCAVQAGTEAQIAGQ